MKPATNLRDIYQSVVFKILFNLFILGQQVLGGRHNLELEFLIIFHLHSMEWP